MQAAIKRMDYPFESIYSNTNRYEQYVKQRMDEGLLDIQVGRTVSHEQVKAELLGYVG